MLRHLFRIDDWPEYLDEDAVEAFRLLERRVVRRVLEPDKPFGRCLDPLEVLGCENGGHLKVIAPQHEDDRHFEPGEPVVDVEPSELVPEMLQRELVSLSELDQIDKVRLVCLQGGPNELAGRKAGVERPAESFDPFP